MKIIIRQRDDNENYFERYKYSFAISKNGKLSSTTYDSLSMRVFEGITKYINIILETEVSDGEE